MQQAIQPGDQMFVNVASLIRSRVPDRKGNVLPADLAFGTYDVKDLASGGGSLSVGALTLDKTFGFHASPPSPDCCANYGDYIDPDFIDLDVDGFVDIDVKAMNACTGQLQILGDITDWCERQHRDRASRKSQGHGSRTGIHDCQRFGTDGGCVGNTLYWENINPTAPVTVQDCPSSSTVSSLTPLSITLLFPGLKTGISAVSSMQVAPATTDWNGYQVSESLTTSSNSCPSSWGNLCSGSSTFTVGDGGQAEVSVNGVETLVGPVFPEQQNMFYDQHTLVSNVSLLPTSSGQTTCTAVCTQTYSCGGASVGSHTITYSFIEALITGTHVTSTEVSEQ